MISATGNSSEISVGRQCGFTLLEIMLVVLVIGLMSTVVLLSLPDNNDGRELRQLGERLTAMFRYARQEAVFSGVTHGILWHDRQPLLVKRDGDDWLVQDDSRLRALQRDAAEYPMFIDQSGQRLDLAQNYETPQIIFTNDGQVSPFVLVIRNTNGIEFSLNDSLELNDGLGQDRAQ